MPKLWKRNPEILLLPNIPMPLHGVNPRSCLGNKWWDKTRKESYASCNYHCESCGVHKTKAKGTHKHLEGHEVYHTDYQQGILTYIRTTPLCPWCHRYIHDGRLTWLLQTQSISSSHFAQIIQHGEKILREANLKRLPRIQREKNLKKMMEDGKMAAWEQWKLVVQGKEFYSKFSSLEEYRKHFKKNKEPAEE